jgi:hypothetical protein
MNQAIRSAKTSFFLPNQKTAKRLSGITLYIYENGISFWISEKLRIRIHHRDELERSEVAFLNNCLVWILYLLFNWQCDFTALHCSLGIPNIPHDLTQNQVPRFIIYYLHLLSTLQQQKIF